MMKISVMGAIMSGQKAKFRYRLGVDVGVASLGLAILDLDNTTNTGNGSASGSATGEAGFKIVGGSVVTWPLPTGAEERRLKRAMRRNIERKERRLDRLSDLLAAHEIGTVRKQMPKDILDQSPIKIRAKATHQRVELAELARAILHLAKHRGSSAFREDDIKDENEARQTALGMDNLRREMAAKGFKTYGQYLRWREKQDMPTRINPNKMADAKDGYAFYPSREMLQEEFGLIWDRQARCSPTVLTNALKKQVEDELFFQRAITTPPPGDCPYTEGEKRLARASRLFQMRRIYEDANHLRFSGRQGQVIPYGKAERDKIVARLMAGEDLGINDLKTTIGQKTSIRVSVEDVKAKKGIDGYPFDRRLGAIDVLGAHWRNADPDTQDQILDILNTEHDQNAAKAALADLMDGDVDAAQRALKTSLPSGWGHMGLTATVKVLDQLKADVIPVILAIEQAGLVHVSTATGDVRGRLPYYGEILVGYTVPPMWVSRYRLETDRPPHTDPLEQKFGRIPNPVVHQALRVIQKAVNAVIKKYGLPESIHIELARDLNKSAEAREEIERRNEKNRKASDKAAEDIRAIGETVNRLNIQKYKLWKEQAGLCLYTGEALALVDLFNGTSNVDHILPRSKTFDDALSNKVICTRAANADKGNKAPYAAFADNSNYDWAAIMRRVEKLSSAKRWRFDANAMQQFEDQDRFRARYGTDNAYIARITRQYLTCLYREPHHVVAVSSHIVGLLRGKWGLHGILGSKSNGKKARDDHRHHFVDALVTACATRAMVGRIQHEAARTERDGLETFVDTIAPPFGTAKMFFNAAREATLERVSLSRKPDHATTGQLHEDTLLGIVDGPDAKGFYVCRKRKKLTDYDTLAALEKSSLKDTLPDLAEIEEAKASLDDIRRSIRHHSVQAEEDLETQRRADIAAGKKGKKVSDRAIYSKALTLHENANGKLSFTLFEKNKLVNIRRAKDGNRPTGGYISGRNHHMDFYVDAKGKIRWQLINMIEANDKNFVPDSARPGHQLLWSAHKEDLLLIDNPDAPEQRIRVIVAKISEGKLGVVPEADARESKDRIMWEKGLLFFTTRSAQRIVTDALGDITWHFPALPKSGKQAPPS